VESSPELRLEGAINRFLLCSVLAKQARRLGRLIPEMRVAELIGVAWRYCAEHEVHVYVDGHVPNVIREQVTEMCPLGGRLSDTRAVCAVTMPWGQAGNGLSTVEQQRREKARPEEERSRPSGIGADIHVFVGTGFDSADSCRNLSGFEGTCSMSHTNGTDRMRQLQL
jgi:hypothetical protein